jgi:hypothetical protein
VDNGLIILMLIITAGNCIVGAGAMNLDQTIWLIPMANVFLSEVVILSGLMVVSAIALFVYFRRTGVIMKTIKVDNADLERMKGSNYNYYA